MNLNDIIKRMNGKCDANVVMRVKKKYISLYRAKMVEMYDKGYIDDPTKFDKELILRVVADLGISELYLASGEISLSNYRLVGFARDQYEEEDEQYEFLNILHDVVRWKECSENLDFLGDCYFNGKSNTSKSLDFFSMLGGIQSKAGLKYDESLSEVLYYSKNKKAPKFDVELVDFNIIFYKKALDLLEIPYKENFKGNPKGFFCKKLSVEQEISYASLIFEGVVPLDGKYGERVIEWLKKKKWNINIDSKYVREKASLWTFVKYMDGSLAVLVDSFIEDRNIDIDSILGIVEEGLLCFKNRESVLMPFSQFVVIGSEEHVCGSEKNSLRGYTGECFSVEYLSSFEEEIPFKGCPIEIYDSKNKPVLVYDLEQTDFINGRSWFKHNNLELVFGSGFLPEDIDVNDLTVLERSIYVLYKTAIEEGIMVGVLHSEATNVEIEKALQSLEHKIWGV